MVSNLLKMSGKYALIAAMLMMGVSAFAQSGKKPGKSRLEIGQTPRPVTLPSSKSGIKYPLIVKDFKLGENRNRPSAIINQHFKNQLLSPTTSVGNKSVATKVIESPVVEVIKLDLNDKIERLFANDRIAVSVAYPNPASSSTTIDFNIPNGNSKAKVLVFNMFATQVAEYELNDDDKRLVIPTENLAEGFYYYKLIVDGKMVNSKKLQIRH